MVAEDYAQDNYKGNRCYKMGMVIDNIAYSLAKFLC